MGRHVAAVVAALATAACSRTPTFDVGPIPFGVTAETQLTYYDISAASLNEIRLAMAQDGPRSRGRRWSAVTTWRLSWQSQTSVVGVYCEPRRVRVRVHTAIHFPRWNPSAQPDSALLVWWEQLNAGLAEHERGHALLAVQAGGAIARALESIQAPCSQLNGRQSDTFNRMVLALNAREEEYDLTTRHGATQIQQARRLQEP